MPIQTSTTDPTPSPSAARIDVLVARFRDRTLPHAEWTHRAHLTVGAWHVQQYGSDEALARLRAGIRALNDAHGTPNTATSGYHETVTRAYVALLAEFLAGCPTTLPLAERVQRLLAGPLAARDVLLRFYSRERLMSAAARAAWVEPDLAVLRTSDVLTAGRSLSGDAVTGAPARAPERVTLRGRFVTVEPLDPPHDGERLYAASHESAAARDVWRYLPDGPFADRASFDAWLAGMRAASDRVAFTLHDHASGRAAGMASYVDIRAPHGGIEVGYIWFAPFLQRTPAATEALYLLLRHAFDDLGYRRMQWKCNALNEKSRAAALRLGFTFEGIFYRHMVLKGHNRDTAWYSMLDGEWPRLRAGFEAWLAPSNFDDEGRQRRALRDCTEGAE